MEDMSDELLAIEMDADNYGDVAAADEPVVPRTFQSEADFLAIKASYTAKISFGSNLEELVAAVPVLAASHAAKSNETWERAKLSKKDVHLLGYAIGEMYFDRRYEEIVALCDKVTVMCEVDARVEKSLEKWSSRCQERLANPA